MQKNIFIRKLFFWMLVALFLITAPAVSLYALGYRFSLEKGIFVYSGSFTIKSTPQESAIFLNGKAVPKGVVNFLNYSYHIDGLRPNKYLLEIKHDGYQTWHKEARVHSGISTEFWNIFLARENFTRKKYENISSENFFISPKEKNIASVKNNPDISVETLNLKNEEISKVFEKEGFYFPNTEKINIEWSPKGDQLIIPASSRENHVISYFIANLENETSDSANLNELTQENTISNVRWDSSEKNFVFYVSNSSLYKINTENPEEKFLLAENIGGYDVGRDKIYYIKNSNGIIYEADIKRGDSIEQITTTALENINFDHLTLIAYDEERIGIITGDKDLYIFNKGEEATHLKKLSEKIMGMHFSNDGKKLVYWTNNEIFTYFVRKWETQPTRSEDQNIHITRSFEKIDNVQWLKDYEHVLYTAGGKIKLIEIDHRDYRNIFDLSELNTQETKMRYNPSKSIVYFIDKNEPGDTEFGIYAINLLEDDEKELEFN